MGSEEIIGIAGAEFYQPWLETKWPGKRRQTIHFEPSNVAPYLAMVTGSALIIINNQDVK